MAGYGRFDQVGLFSESPVSQGLTKPLHSLRRSVSGWNAEKLTVVKIAF